MGVALTTYDTLDDPPSSNLFFVKGIQGFWEDLFSCSTRVTPGLFQLLTYPISSMYGIFTYIWLFLIVESGKCR